MDLTFASAFSAGGFIGHFAYMLLVLSMVMRTLFWLRVLVIASASVGIFYSIAILRDPVSSFWETALVTVNVIQIALEWRKNRSARFSEEEADFVATRLQGLNPHEARRLLDLGAWCDGQVGAQLTAQGEAVTHLVYLASGTVDVQVNGRSVATCAKGNFVGEMSLVDGGPASATTRIATPARYWAIPSPAIADLRAQGSRLASALELCITHDMKSKILAANMRDDRASAPGAADSGLS